MGKIKTILLLIISSVFFLGNVNSSVAQEGRKVLQLSGIILGNDSTSGIPGVHVYVPKAGRGTTSNRVGYFSLPVLVGDEMVVSAVGYEKQYFRVPDYEKDNLTIVIELISDTTFLETIEVMPFPTEEIFKEAVLALNIPLNEFNFDNIDQELLALMLRTAPTTADPNANHSYYMDNWQQSQTDRYMIRSNPLTNPFNWANFFRSLRSNKNN